MRSCNHRGYLVCLTLALAGLLQYHHHIPFNNANQIWLDARQQPRRGVVMCAWDAQTLRLALTQINMIRALEPAHHNEVRIFHAGELDRGDTTQDFYMRALEALPGVVIDSLDRWRRTTYNMTDDTLDLKTFRGFYCKLAALLAADFDIVAILDLDTILMDNPWTLMRHHTFEEYGGMFFRERRLRNMPNGFKETPFELNRKVLHDIWRLFNPGKQTLSRYITEMPIYNGWSWHTQETAVVLYDKRRTGAVQTLTRMLSPELLPIIGEISWGDTEFFWLSFALSDLPVELSAVMPFDVGHTDFFETRSLYGVERVSHTCDTQGVFGQFYPWAQSSGDIFYLNGFAIEKLYFQNDTSLFAYNMSTLITYQQAVETDANTKMCSHGGLPLPQHVLDRVRQYLAAYHDLAQSLQA